jgi:hypothetical protein
MTVPIQFGNTPQILIRIVACSFPQLATLEIGAISLVVERLVRSPRSIWLAAANSFYKTYLPLSLLE